MRRHTRYILGQLLATTAVVTVGLAAFAWLTQSLRFLHFIVNKGLSLPSFLGLTLLLLPTVTVVVLPVAVLGAVIHTYNRLIIDRELVVMRSVGLSSWSLARPALCLAAVAVALGYAVTLYLMPASFRTFKDEQSALRADLGHVILQQGAFDTLLDKVTVFVRERSPDGELRGILLHDARDPQLAVTVMAESGILGNGPAGPVLTLYQGNRQEVGQGDDAPRLLRFRDYSLPLDTLEEAPGIRYRESTERYLGELWRTPGNDRFANEGHRRVVMPLYALAVAAMAIAALLAGEFDRRRQWPRIAAAWASGLGFLVFAHALAGLMANHVVLVSLYYALPFVCAGGALWTMTRERRPSAAPGRTAVAG